ncbi:OmpH family outer membrane protein [bacterium]|nr:OmpH family outer membrane protein [bacterium]
MKNTISLAVLLVGALAQAEAGFKLGFVDLQKTLQTVEAGKTAKAALEKEVTAKRTGLEKQQQQLQKEAEEFEKKAGLMNEGAKTQKQQELQKKFSELQKLAAESQMELQKRERELTKPIIDEIRAVVESLGKEKSMTLVLEKNEGAVLYAQSGEDITEAVIERFNTKSKSKKK